MAVIMKGIVSWKVTPCYLVSRQTVEKPTSCILNMVAAVGSCETSVNGDRQIRR